MLRKTSCKLGSFAGQGRVFGELVTPFFELFRRVIRVHPVVFSL